MKGLPKEKCNQTEISTQICATSENEYSACAVDLGSGLTVYDDTDPIHSHYYLIGLTSNTPKNCYIKNLPAIYTNISDYSDWILNKMYLPKPEMCGIQANGKEIDINLNTYKQPW